MCSFQMCPSRSNLRPVIQNHYSNFHLKDFLSRSKVSHIIPHFWSLVSKPDCSLSHRNFCQFSPFLGLIPDNSAYNFYQHDPTALQISVTLEFSCNFADHIAKVQVTPTIRSSLGYHGSLIENAVRTKHITQLPDSLYTNVITMGRGLSISIQELSRIRGVPKPEE